MEINVVPQENCPRCGGGEEFGNRPKVGHQDGTWSWRCYNEDCTLGYWIPGTTFEEDVPTDEERKEIERATREWVENIEFIDVTTVTVEGTSTERVSLK